MDLGDFSCLDPCLDSPVPSERQSARWGAENDQENHEFPHDTLQANVRSSWGSMVPPWVYIVIFVTL